MAESASTAEERNEKRRAASGIAREVDIKIPLRDGSYVLADVYYPTSGEPQPVVVRMGVYGRAFDCGSICDEQGRLASEEREDAWHDKGQPPDLAPPMAFYENMVTANVFDWVPRGYVCLRVDSRGTGMTPGVIDPLSVTEKHDYFEVIEWAAKQAWCNGVVGLYGGSYNANTAWNVAGLSPLSLKAMIAFAGDVDLYRELAYPGGLEMKGFLETWFNGNVKAVQGRSDPELVDLLGRVSAHPFDEPEHYGENGDILSRADLTKIKIPFLTSVCLGAPIHGRGGAEGFIGATNAPSKELLVVDANYWPFMYRDCLDQQFAFFDRHLKGDSAAPSYPPVRYIMRPGDGSYKWQSDTQWPLSDTEYLQFYLDAPAKGGKVGTLGRDVPGKPGVYSYSAEAPLDAAGRGECATFETQPLSTDLTIAGPVSVVLWVSASASDMDVYAILRVLDAAGKEVPYPVRPLAEGCPLSHGCLKVSHRATDSERSTEWRPYHTHRKEDYAPLTPDEVVPISVEMTLTTAQVKKGSRLQLIVEAFSGQSAATWKAYGGIAAGDSQAGDRQGVFGGRPYEQSYHVGVENRIHTGPEHSSKLLIPSVPGTVD